MSKNNKTNKNTTSIQKYSLKSGVVGLIYTSTTNVVKNYTYVVMEQSFTTFIYVKSLPYFKGALKAPGEKTKMTKVQNMTSSRGNKVANQFILHDNGSVTFQSYDTLIAKYDWDNKELILNGDWWDYSATTRKYFYLFVQDHTPLSHLSRKDFLSVSSGGVVPNVRLGVL